MENTFYVVFGGRGELTQKCLEVAELKTSAAIVALSREGCPAVQSPAEGPEGQGHRRLRGFLPLHLNNKKSISWFLAHTSF